MMKELETIGLTQRQAKVYLSLLELGSSTVGKIINKSKVPSSKIYEILGELISKGMASFIVKNNTKFYQASDPESLIDLINEKKDVLQNILPELKVKKNSAKEESAILFQGKEGLKTALRKVLRVLNPKEEYLVYISPFEDLESQSSKIFLNNFNLQRDEKEIKTKLLIHRKQKEIMKEHYFDTLKKQQVRFTNFSFPSRLGIFRDHILIISVKKEISCVLMQSSETYGMYKDFFMSLWKQAKS